MKYEIIDINNLSDGLLNDWKLSKSKRFIIDKNYEGFKDILKYRSLEVLDKDSAIAGYFTLTKSVLFIGVSSKHKSFRIL